LPFFMPGSTTLTAFEFWNTLVPCKRPESRFAQKMTAKCVMEEAIPHQFVDEIWGEMFHHLYLSIYLSI
jgi:hypothetical protein